MQILYDHFTLLFVYEFVFCKCFYPQGTTAMSERLKRFVKEHRESF